MKNEVKQAGMKRCTKCKKSKDKSRFGKDKRLNVGLSYWCIKCEKEYQHAYYLRTSKATRRNFKYEDSHRVVGGVKQKLCRKCRKWKAEREFHANPISRDGLKATCKKCAKKSRKLSNPLIPPSLRQ